MRLIDEPTTGRAYVFGFKAIRSVIAEYWWLYALIVLVDAALSAWGSGPSNFHTGSLTGIVATYLALATTARMVRRDARMNVIDVLALIAIVVIFILGALVLFGIAFLVSLLSSGVAVIAFLGMFFVFVWLAIKFGIAQIAYVNARKRSIGDALIKSFDAISGEYWWSAFGLALATSATAIVTTGCITALGYRALTGGAFAPAFFVALPIDALFALMTVWSTSSMTAFASALGVLTDDSDEGAAAA